MNRAGHIVVAALLLACKVEAKKVEAKKDTPQAAIATLIKAFGADETELVDQLFDPLLPRIEARRSTCSLLAFQHSRCVQKILDSIDSNGILRGSRSQECESLPGQKTCTCGAEGQAAVAQASSFQKTEAYRLLSQEKMSSGACTITEAKSLPVELKQDLYSDPPTFTPVGELFNKMPSLKDDLCDDIAKLEAEEYSSVTFQCKGDPVSVVLRRNPDGWRFLGFDRHTWVQLATRDIVIRGEEAQKRSEADLNKDLR